MTYAYARTLNAQTGDWTFTTTFPGATSPATELVKRILRTTKGQCLLDPAMGVDWAKVDPLGTGAASLADALIRSALAGLVTRGVIANLSVAVEVDGQAGRLLYTVTFTDVRLAEPQVVRGSR